MRSLGTSDAGSAAAAARLRRWRPRARRGLLVVLFSLLGHGFESPALLLFPFRLGTGLVATSADFENELLAHVLATAVLACPALHLALG